MSACPALAGWGKIKKRGARRYAADEPRIDRPMAWGERPIMRKQPTAPRTPSATLGPCRSREPNVKEVLA